MCLAPIDQFAEVQVIGDQEGIATNCDREHLRIGDARGEIRDVGHVVPVGGEAVGDQRVDVLVSQQNHRATETTCSVRTASRANRRAASIPSRVKRMGEQFLDGVAARKLFQDVLDGDARAGNDGLASHDVRIHGD